MIAVQKFMEKFDRAVGVTDALARRAGYQELVTDDQKLDVATAWSAVVTEFDSVAREVMTAIARASVFVGDAGTMAERIDVLKAAIQNANTAELKRARAAADADWRRG